jgi:alpha-L-fucosidase
VKTIHQGRKGGVAVVLAAAVLAVVSGPAAAGARAKGPDSTIAEGGNDPTGFDMAPETNLTVVSAAVAAIPEKLPAGPYQPTWDSLKQNYKVPQWFVDAKFGIFMHWGLYSVAAYNNEWYEQHMYNVFIQWHAQHFGPQDRFGYKDFIPKFTAEKWNPQAWAALLKKAGAKYVIPTAQHHDNFSLWDSRFNPWNAKAMGPHRDLIGDLAKAVRAQGIKFGVSNHGIEAFQFIHPDASTQSKALMAELKAKQADIFDPAWQDFYHVADRSDQACRKFLINWAQRNAELIDKYQPDMLYFDNGVDQRYLDPLKLWVAAYYYNRAAAWGKDVSINTKKAAYAPEGTNVKTIGSIIDFETVADSPTGIRTGVWQVDETISTSSWGYINGLNVLPARAILPKLIDTVAKNGNYLLNISPKPDGTIPDDQQATLLDIGQWLEINGEAIYGTHSWTRFGEGGGRGAAGLDVRFTVKADDLYAIIIGQWPGREATVASLATGQTAEARRVTTVTMLGSPGKLDFTQDASGLKVKLPATAPCKIAYTLKISGLKMNANTATRSGNPM